MQRSNTAIQDFRNASNQYRIWLHLGVLEVKQRYRRSVLGPWWISISMLIFIVAMGAIFSRLLAQSLSEYIPYFTTGFLLWSFISSSINESTDIFKSNSGLIKQIKLPLNLYVLKFFTRNFLIFIHNFVIYLLVIVFFQINPGWNCLLALPGLALLLINLYWISLFIGLISTRYRDLVPVISSCMQILFFITPISWMPKLLGQDSLIVKLNPIVYLLEVVRQPLLGHAPTIDIWMINIALAALGIWASLSFFNSVRARIPFWIE